MTVRGLLYLGWALLACAFAVRPARAYVLESSDQTPWWDETATNKVAINQGDPITVTWSIAPDGAGINGAPSNLIAFLAAQWGAHPTDRAFDQQPWFFLFEQSFARLSALSGVTLQYEPNDDGVTPTPAAGQAFSNAYAARGILGVRGDVRIGGKSFLPDTISLAATYFPNYGEMMINTDQTVYLYGDFETYRYFRNTIMHEAMHAVGVQHVYSSNANFLVEPIIVSSFEGPQLDDVLALQRLYGDALEKNGGNDSHLTATPLGALGRNQSLARGTLGASTIVDPAGVDFLSIDDDSDVDFFSFTLAETLHVKLNLTPQGATYQMGPAAASQSTYATRQLSDLSLALFDSTGMMQIGPTADAAGLGGGETISQTLAAGTYFARVAGAHNDVQLYQLAVQGFAGPDFNGDGFVDGEDILSWSTDFGREGDALHDDGDANGDLAVSGADFLAWQRELLMPPGGLAHLAGVPEPAGGPLAVGAMLAALAARRRRA